MKKLQRLIRGLELSYLRGFALAPYLRSLRKEVFALCFIFTITLTRARTFSMSPKLSATVPSTFNFQFFEEACSYIFCSRHFVGGAKTVILDVTEKTSKPVLLLGDIAFKMSHISTLLGVTKYDEVVRLIFHTGMEVSLSFFTFS